MIGYLEPHGRAETDGAGRRASSGCRAAASTYRGTALEEMDLPAILAPRARAVPDRRARPHQRARRSSTRKRYEDIEDVLDAGIDVLLDRQRPAPRVAQRPGRRADRRPRARDVPGRGARRAPTRSCCRPHARGADRAPAGGQGLPARADRGGAQQLLPDREPRGAARGRAAPGRRGGRGQARCVSEPSRSARARSSSLERRAAGGRRAAARAGRRPTPSSQRARAPRVALGAAPRRATSTCSCVRARPRPEPTTRSASSSRRCAGSPRCSARSCSIEEGDDVAEAVARVAAERGTTYVLIGRRAPARGLAPPARVRCPSG